MLHLLNVYSIVFFSLEVSSHLFFLCTIYLLEKQLGREEFFTFWIWLVVSFWHHLFVYLLHPLPIFPVKLSIESINMIQVLSFFLTKELQKVL